MNNVDKDYIRIAQEILDKGSLHSDRTGTGTKRIFGVMTKIDLAEGFPILTTRKIFMRTAIEELRWMISGSTDVAKLQEKNVHIWDGNGSKEECEKFGRIEGDLGPIYGHQWRNWNASKKSNLEIDLLKNANKYQDYYSETNKRWVNKDYNDDGIDQIKYMMDLIQNNPDSRRILMSSWNLSEALDVNPPPCHPFVQLSVIENKLNLMLVMRSQDYFLGRPYNILMYALLMHLICKTCELDLGEFTFVTGDTHIYIDHIDQIKDQIKKEPFPLPTLIVNDRLKGKGFQGLMDFTVDDITLINYQSHGVLKGKMSV